jgi:hypothetical protein
MFLCAGYGGILAVTIVQVTATLTSNAMFFSGTELVGHHVLGTSSISSISSVETTGSGYGAMAVMMV